jgi:RND family efflux transporter MFP subunit
LQQQQATLASAGSSKDRVRSQQDQLVENARLAVLKEDLQAYLVVGGSENLDHDHTPPTVSGTYTCEREGVYRIELYRSHAQSGSTMTYSGLESGRESVSTIRPVPLGKCGLYVQFPDNFVSTRTLVWEISIPNTRSATYQTRLSAYKAARENRRLSLEDAERTPILSAQIAEARAAVLAAEAAFAETRLVAPFAGVVTLVDAVRGAIASPGLPALSLISSNAFEIKVLIPEDDIGEIAVGDRATVTLDAYDDATFEANVSFISPSATTDTGTASFEVTLQFASIDDRIRAGLSTDVDIIAAEHKNVLAVPTRAIIEENGGRYVRVLASDTSYRLAPVSTGLSGSGVTEIVSGLAEGERIVTFANEEALATLTKED